MRHPREQTLTHPSERYETMAKWIREAKAANKALRNMADDKTGIRKLPGDNQFRTELEMRRNNLRALAAAATAMVNEIDTSEGRGHTWC